MARSVRHRDLVRCTLAATLSLCVSIVSAFEAPKTLPDGWDGTLELGADATTGSSRTSSLSLESSLSWHVGRLETQARAKVLRSNASIEIERQDTNGEPVLDARGEPVVERVSERTNDRLGVALEPRWYFEGERRYLFGLVDYETNEPAGVKRSLREVAGVGYRLWNDKANFLAAGVGIGHKRLEATDGQSSDGGIGYFGIKLVLQLSERVKLNAGLDTDFGGDSTFTELGLAIGLKVSASAALKLAYDARVNEGVAERADRSGNGLDGRASIKIELDVL